MLTVMTGRATPLITKDFVVTFMLTVRSQLATNLMMKNVRGV